MPGFWTSTTNSPSGATLATCKYLFTSLIFVAFFEGVVPCFKCAHARLRDSQSCWSSYHPALLLYGTAMRASRTSDAEHDLTTESASSDIYLQTCHRLSPHSGGLLLAALLFSLIRDLSEMRFILINPLLSSSRL